MEVGVGRRRRLRRPAGVVRSLKNRAMTRNNWRPRHGQPLMKQQNPGWLEENSKLVLLRLPKTLLNPIWAIVVGSLITYTGKSELYLRSVGLLAVAIWLATDVWALLFSVHVESRRRRIWSRLRFVLGWGCTSLFLLGVMGTMWWGLSNRLEDQQEDVFNHLTGAMHLPPSGDPRFSVFTITNGGSKSVQESQFLCRINKAVYENGATLDQTTVRFQSNTTPPPMTGGEGTSTSCLATFSSSTGRLLCADLTFRYEYSLSTEPATRRVKAFRFVYEALTGWYSVPSHDDESRCKVAELPLPDTSDYDFKTACSSGCDYTTVQDAIDHIRCGSVVFVDLNETRAPNFSADASRLMCTPARQVIFQASLDPKEDVKKRKLK